MVVKEMERGRLSKVRINGKIVERERWMDGGKERVQRVGGTD